MYSSTRTLCYLFSVLSSSLHPSISTNSCWHAHVFPTRHTQVPSSIPHPSANNRYAQYQCHQHAIDRDRTLLFFFLFLVPVPEGVHWTIILLSFNFSKYSHPMSIMNRHRPPSLSLSIYPFIVFSNRAFTRLFPTTRNPFSLLSKI